MTGSRQLSLEHLVREPTKEANGAPPLLLLLHGVGSNEWDLMDLTPHLDERFFVVSVRAPIPLGPDAYAWFHAEFTPDGPVIEPGEAEESQRTLLKFIDEIIEAYGVDPGRVCLMGFSQGTILSLSAALARPDKVAGVVAMSGRILPEIRPLMAPPEELEGLPILLLHGTEDSVLPIHNGRASRDTLASLPVRLDYREYRMEHHVTDESLADVAAWLSKSLSARTGEQKEKEHGG